MKKMIYTVTSALVMSSLLLNTSQVFADTQGSQTSTQTSIITAGNKKILNRVEKRVENSQERKEIKSVVRQNPELKAELQELRKLHQENNKLNQEIRQAILAYYEKMKTELKGDSSEAKVTQIKSEIQQIKAELKKVVELGHQKKKTMHTVKETILKGDVEAAKNQATEAQKELQSLIEAKKKLLHLIQSK